MKSDDLKRAREKMNLTQSALAKKLDVHVMTVSKWERGEIEIPRAVELALKEIGRAEAR